MKKNKNLIIFMPFIGGGGVEKNLYIISNFLVKKKINVKICTVTENKKREFNNNIKFITPKKKVSEKTNLRIKYLISLFTLYNFLKKNRDSIVFAFQANIYCVLLCHLLKIKIIVRSNSSPSGWSHNFIKKFIYKSIISKADCVVVNSLDFKRQMQDQFKINVNCIFNPLNINTVKKLSKENNADNFFIRKKNQINILNIGRYTEQKDQITILRAVNSLKNKIKIKLLIVGKGIEKKKLERYINENDLNKFVKLRTFTKNPYKIIKQCDIFILSSKYEGLPNVLLEAACLKKFIISTKCPTGPREILMNGKGGLFFKIGNHHDLAKKIVFYLKNKKELKVKSIRCYKNLQRYDYNLNLKKYLSLINFYMKIDY